MPGSLIRVVLPPLGGVELWQNAGSPFTRTSVVIMTSIAKVVGFIAFLEWGLIHLAAGTITVTPALQDNVNQYYINVYSEFPGSPALVREYTNAKFPKYSNRVLLQHGLNLFWAGAWSIMLCYFMVHPTRAVWLLGLVPYLFDVGYFIAIDLNEGAILGGKMGEAQTFIVSTGLFCAAWIAMVEYGVKGAELALTMIVPGLLFAAAAANQLGMLKEEL